jgi:hypothetical protein
MARTTPMAGLGVAKPPSKSKMGVAETTLFGLGEGSLTIDIRDTQECCGVEDDTNGMEQIK